MEYILVVSVSSYAREEAYVCQYAVYVRCMTKVNNVIHVTNMIVTVYMNIMYVF